MSKQFIKLFFATTLVAAILFSVGCSQLRYYTQSASGQMEIINKRRPITAVLADPATSPELKQKLEAVMRIRDFASRELGLPDNQSYRGYADLQRPFVVWNVFATDELSLKPREWCFPVAGCVNYKGYFAEADAEAFATMQRENGFDVFVGSVPAYSTLGYFDDPVLNTFIHYPEPELARLIFHELAHQVVYVKDDSVFNESFATTVEREGVLRWLVQQGDGAKQSSLVIAQTRKTVYNQLVIETRVKLENLYASAMDAQKKRERKREIFNELLENYARKKIEWGGYTGYDRWMNASTNNAVIAAFGIYNQQEPAFSALLASQSNDLPKFYAAVKALAKQGKAERNASLEAMTNSENKKGAATLRPQ